VSAGARRRGGNAPKIEDARDRLNDHRIRTDCSRDADQARRLDGSVPIPEALAMIDDSYDLVVKGLTRAQRAELEKL
jgi:hypothetical protein